MHEIVRKAPKASVCSYSGTSRRFFQKTADFVPIKPHTTREHKARFFLRGFLVCGPGHPPRRTYLEEGSKEHHEARKALLRLLRDSSKPLGGGLRELLADLFDPSKELPRKLVFEKRTHCDAIDRDVKNEWQKIISICAVRAIERKLRRVLLQTDLT